MGSYKPLYQLQVCLQQRWCWSCSDKALKVVNSISLDENKLLTFYPCSIRKRTSLTRLVLGQTHQPLVPHELGFSWTWNIWIKGCHSCSLNVSRPSRSILLHMFLISPFNVSLSFFALAHVIGPFSTSNGSLAWLRLVLGWSASHLQNFLLQIIILFY